jgi:hypothetical protein
VHVLEPTEEAVAMRREAEVALSADVCGSFDAANAAVQRER